jgi:hypothetical protein
MNILLPSMERNTLNCVETTNMNLPWPHKSPYSISGDFVKYFEEENQFRNIFWTKGPLYLSINLPPQKTRGDHGVGGKCSSSTYSLSTEGTLCLFLDLHPMALL